MPCDKNAVYRVDFWPATAVCGSRLPSPVQLATKSEPVFRALLDGWGESAWASFDTATCTFSASWARKGVCQEKLDVLVRALPPLGGSTGASAQHRRYCPGSPDCQAVYQLRVTRIF